MGVAAISLGSTTYAWFSNIDTVSADNAIVKVDVPTSLLINNKDDLSTPETEWTNYISLKDQATGTDTAVTSNSRVNPVRKTLEAGQLPSFEELDADGVKYVLEDGTFDAPEGKSIDDYLVESVGDVFNDTFWLKYDGDTTDYATVEGTIKLKGNNTTLGKAVKWEVYEYNGTSWSPVMVSDGAEGTQALAGNFANATAEGVTVTWEIGNIYGQEARCYHVVVYLDGDNENCYNGALQSMADYSLDFSFKKTNND